MRRLLTAALITAAFASGCASARRADGVQKSPAAEAASVPAGVASAPPDVGHSPGTFSFAHPFNRRPEWIASDYWAQDHPVLFVGVVVPAAILAAVLYLEAATLPGWGC